MTVEILSIIVSTLALLFSGFSFHRSSALVKGDMELKVRDMIFTAKCRYTDLVIQQSRDPENGVLPSAVHSAMEDVANAYDEACAKYIDKKIDRARFKKMYSGEIRNLVENQHMKENYVMPQSKYQATVKVYDEWNRTE